MSRASRWAPYPLGPQEFECWLYVVPQFTHAAEHTETLDVLPTRNPKIIFKALATGAVLYSPQDEVYFGLNPVGVRVWELLPPAFLLDLFRVGVCA